MLLLGSTRNCLGKAKETLQCSIAAICDGLLELVLPTRCAGCNALLPVGHSGFCPLCSISVLPVVSPCKYCGCTDSLSICTACKNQRPLYASARATYIYGGALALAIQRFKYSKCNYLARQLGKELSVVLQRWITSGAKDLDLHTVLVVSVPLHRSQLAARGFNQSQLLALWAIRALEHCNMSKLSLSSRALVRQRPTAPQVGQSRAKRQRNVAGAFIARSSLVRERHIVLIDDVMTTGATADECTRALLAAGARDVTVLTLARAG